MNYNYVTHQMLSAIVTLCSHCPIESVSLYNVSTSLQIILEVRE